MPARYLHDLISGAEMDLTCRGLSDLRPPPPRVLLPRSWHQSPHCNPRLWLSRRARPGLCTKKLGLAFQLTNIIRDVHEDYQIGPRLSS